MYILATHHPYGKLLCGREHLSEQATRMHLRPHRLARLMLSKSLEPQIGHRARCSLTEARQ
jgi:hypothetical protein